MLLGHVDQQFQEENRGLSPVKETGFHPQLEYLFPQRTFRVCKLSTDQ